MSVGDTFMVRVSMGDRFRVRMNVWDRFRDRVIVGIHLGLGSGRDLR